MTTFFMFGKYDSAAVGQISAERTVSAREAISAAGGNLIGIYALLGDHDLVVLVELPSVADAVKLSIAIGKLAGIKFSTAPAISVEEFDRIAGQA
jgi:uncharacterized protein with GYD domain